jgi:excisionase family DNA binding protein
VEAPVTDGELLKVEDVAARLKVNPETVRVWLRQGRLRGSRPGGTRMGWRVPEAELRRFISAGSPAQAG